MEAINTLNQKRKRKKMTWKVRDKYDNKNCLLPDLNNLSSDELEKAKKMIPEFIEKYFVEI